MSQLKAIQDLLLTDVSSMYNPSDRSLIAEQVFPIIESDMSTGKLGAYGTGHLRIEQSYKAGRGKYRRVEAITRSTSSYSIVGHGLEELCTKDDYRNVQKPFDAEKDKVISLSAQIMLEKEKAVGDTLTSTATMTQNTTLSGTGQLSDFANSDPIAKFQAARSAVRNGCGVQANAAIMDWAVFNVIRFHPGLLDALGFKQNRPGGLQEDELALAMGVKKILMPDVVYESAAEGQTSSLLPVWGKHIIFAVCPEKAEPRQVSLGYQVRFRGSSPRKIYKYAVNNPPESNAILCEDEYQFLVSNAAAGYLIYNAIA